MDLSAAQSLSPSDARCVTDSRDSLDERSSSNLPSSRPQTWNRPFSFKPISLPLYTTAVLVRSSWAAAGRLRATPTLMARKAKRLRVERAWWRRLMPKLSGPARQATVKKESRSAFQRPGIVAPTFRINCRSASTPSCRVSGRRRTVGKTASAERDHVYSKGGKVPRLVARRVRDDLKLDVPLELQDEVSRLLSDPTRCNSPPFEQSFGLDVGVQGSGQPVLLPMVSGRPPQTPSLDTASRCPRPRHPPRTRR